MNEGQKHHHSCKDREKIAPTNGQFIGNPKQPTISIYSLVEGEYQVTQFQDSDALRQDAKRLHIQAPTFPELNLTPQQIFIAGTSGIRN